MNSDRFELFGIDLFKIIIVVAVTAFCLLFFGLLAGSERFIDDTMAWYGSFHYYVESLASGHFPYWDPYMMTGSYFYPNISHHGLLEPVVLVLAFIRKTAGISLLTLYCYFLIFRLVVFTLGAFFFYRYVTKSNMSAIVAALVLFFALPPSYFRQNGAIDVIYLTPFALYFCLLFFEAPSGRPKYLYLFCLALISGISMNIYIPAYYLFNFVAFLLLLFLLRIVRIGELTGFLRQRKSCLSLAAAILLVAMMTAPPVMVLLKDASGGELFPILRITHKNNGNLKRIVASEVTSSSLSGKFCNNLGVFSSYGNLVNLLYADMRDIPFFRNHRFLSEIGQYIGLVPFIFCMLGFIYSKSRYRWLAIIMLVLSAINMFSFEGIVSRPYNTLQMIFNEIFPPLKMVECRETFGSFFLFYLCLLLGLGLQLLFDGEKFRQIAKEKYRQILLMGAMVILLKILITWYFGAKIVFSSKQDIFVLAQVILFLILVFLYARRKVTKKGIVIALLSLVFTDLFLYNYVLKTSILLPRQDLDNLFGEGTRSTGDFQFFREPIVAPPHLAFAESILKTKGVLAYGSNHTLFSTKRYYDLLTNVPAENQLTLGGVSYPIVRFFPANDTIKYDRKQTLQHLARAKAEEIPHRLLIEIGKPAMPEALGELKDFAEYEDLRELNPDLDLLQEFTSWYLTQQGQALKDRRDNFDRFLHTPEYSLAVQEFSLNDITVSVKNDNDGYLFYGDGWSKYWRAFDGDREIPLSIANYNSKAVYLEKGAHTVRFVFDPRHYKIGLAFYYCGLFFLIGIISFLYVTKKKPFQGPVLQNFSC